MPSYAPLSLKGTRVMRLKETDNILVPSSKLESPNGDIVDVVALNGILATAEPIGFTNRQDTTMSFDNSTTTFTLAPASTSFVYYNRNKKMVVSDSMSVTMSKVEGVHYISINVNNELAESTVQFYDIPVAVVYYDASGDEVIFIGDCRKIIGNDSNSFAIDFTRNTCDILTGFDFSGIINGDGSDDEHCKFSLTEGHVKNYSVLQAIINDTSGNPFSQVLDKIHMPLYYNIVSSGVIKWRYATVSEYPVIYTTTTTIKYNDITTGLMPSPDNSYVTTYVLITNNINNPIIGVVGKAYNSLSEAINENVKDIKIENLGLAFKVAYKLIFKTANAFTNFPKASLVYYQDLRYTVSNVIQNQAASDVTVSTSNFDKNLSSADATIQHALDTIDDIQYEPNFLWVTFDGSTNIISLSDVPRKVVVFREGAVVQQEGTDYTINNDTIELSDNAADLDGVVYFVMYWI